MPPGAKPGQRFGGRQKGTPNKHKQSFREWLKAYCAEKNADPFVYMADMIADMSTVVVGVDEKGQPIERPAVTKDQKLSAAKELAQYVEPRLKATEHSGGVSIDLGKGLSVLLEFARGTHGRQ
jgi:predicted HTH transcriptional regulator